MFVYFRRKDRGKKLGRDPRQFDDPNYKGPERQKRKNRKSILTLGKSSDEGMHHHPGLTKQREQILERAISLLETQIVYKTLQEKASK
jgi:hypothetical protein